MRRRHLALAAKAAFGLALIWLLASSVDWRALGGVWARIAPLPLTGLFVISFLMVAVSNWKWKLLLESQGIELPWRYLLGTYFIGYFFTNFLPTGIGGDAVRALRVGQATGRRGASLLAVFFERFTGLVVLLSWVTAVPLLSPGILRSAPLAAIVVMAAAGLVVFALAAARGSEVYALFSRALPRGFVAEKAALVARHFQEFRLGPAMTARVMLVTAAFYFLTFLNVLLAFRTFGIDVAAREVATYTPVVMFISMVPFSISSLGIAEGAYVFCFLMAGVPKEASLSVALIMRLKLIVLGLIGGGVYLLGRQPAHHGAQGGAEEAQR